MESKETQTLHISLQTLALMVTSVSGYTLLLFKLTIDHCISEYKTGVYVQGRLDAAITGELYNQHLVDVLKFDEENKCRSLKIQKKLFKQAW